MYIFEDFYRNDIYSEKLLKRDGNYNAARSSFGYIYQQLRDALPKEQHEIIDNLITCVDSLEYQSGKVMFLAGFSLGRKYSEILKEK